MGRRVEENKNRVCMYVIEIEIERRVGKERNEINTLTHSRPPFIFHIHSLKTDQRNQKKSNRNDTCEMQGTAVIFFVVLFFLLLWAAGCCWCSL